MNDLSSDARMLKSHERWLYGGLGALAPIVVAALTLDIVAVFKNPDFAVIFAWFFRCVLLFVVGGFVAFLRRTETDLWNCFVTGISAPALITTAFAGNATRPTNRPDISLSSSANAGEIKPNDLSIIASKVPIYTTSDLSEGLVDKLSRGFFGSNPYVSFVVLPAMDESDAKKISALLKVYNYCQSVGQVVSDFDAGVKGEARDFQKSGKPSSDVFIVKSPVNDTFVPVVSAANPQAASAYGFMVDRSIIGSGVLVARQSELEGQIRLVLLKSRGFKSDVSIFAADLAARIYPTCNYYMVLKPQQ